MIVDDSAVARAILARILGAFPDFAVVAQAGDARAAMEMLDTTDIDIVLLDVEMPGASGLEALPTIVAAGRGARVLIVSSMAEEGAEVTVRALAAGAADALPKPGAAAFSGRFSEVLADRLRRIGRVDRMPEAAAGADEPLAAPRLREMPDAPLGCLALGASTGGLPALIDFLRALPPRIGAPILVTQHLPEIFMPHFARQLKVACGRPALVAADGAGLTAETIHVAPGDAHLTLVRNGLEVAVKLDRRRAPSGCRPSVDPMLTSVAAAYGDGALGVILSGMGRDGCIGARRLVEAGGAVLAQDRASCSVWGMPRVVAEAGLAAAVMPPADLARRVGARVASCR
ncbi:chemotaxis-specific protein-glutamate methyltransferase CheB [Sphingosinicella sp.]|uniref:chemotaxis-specific protein-glutamate methyltransferase CheB n=1 Tax=Sphingosinicella sp. TaxID=1917971 RepID=UPI004038110D